MSAMNLRSGSGFCAEEWEVGANGTGLRRIERGGSSAEGYVVAETRAEVQDCLLEARRAQLMLEELEGLRGLVWNE